MSDDDEETISEEWEKEFVEFGDWCRKELYDRCLPCGRVATFGRWSRLEETDSTYQSGAIYRWLIANQEDSSCETCVDRPNRVFLYGSKTYGCVWDAGQHAEVIDAFYLPLSGPGEVEVMDDTSTALGAWVRESAGWVPNSTSLDRSTALSDLLAARLSANDDPEGDPAASRYQLQRLLRQSRKLDALPLFQRQERIELGGVVFQRCELVKPAWPIFLLPHSQLSLYFDRECEFAVEYVSLCEPVCESRRAFSNNSRIPIKIEGRYGGGRWFGSAKETCLSGVAQDLNCPTFECSLFSHPRLRFSFSDRTWRLLEE